MKHLISCGQNFTSRQDLNYLIPSGDAIVVFTLRHIRCAAGRKQQGAVVRRVDSAIHRIAIFQSLENCSFSSITLIKVQYFSVKVLFH